MNRVPPKALATPLMILVAVVLLANIIVAVGWTAPRLGARSGIGGGAASIAELRERIEPPLQGLRDTYGRLGEAEADLEEFRDRLVGVATGSDLIGMLATAGRNVGMELADATLQYANVDELGVVQLAISFPVTGTYAAVRALLDELAALPVFVIVDGISLRGLGDANGGGPPGLGGNGAVRIDLAISVFLDDPELAAVVTRGSTPVAAPPRQVSRTATRLLETATSSDEPDEIVDALLAGMRAIPPLPVAANASVLGLQLDRLDQPAAITEPRRNLFAVVLPPPPPVVVDDTPVAFEPEPQLPVRLLGVARIEGRWHASLSDGTQVFVVEAGDSLLNGVAIVAVGADYAEVTFGGDRTRLTLEGTRP